MPRDIAELEGPSGSLLTPERMKYALALASDLDER